MQTIVKILCETVKTSATYAWLYSKAILTLVDFTVLLRSPTCSLHFNCLIAIYYCDSGYSSSRGTFGIYVAHGCFLNSIWRGTRCGRRPWMRSRECAIKITYPTSSSASIAPECIWSAAGSTALHACVSISLVHLPPLTMVPSRICARSVAGIKPLKTLIWSISCLVSVYLSWLRLKHRYVIRERDLWEIPQVRGIERDLFCMKSLLDWEV